MINTVICGDCLEVMKQIPSGSVDLVLTDPPYGIGAASDNRFGRRWGGSATSTKDYGHSEWDSIKPNKDVFSEIFRISKNQVIFGANHFISSIPFDSPCWIVWDKDNGDNTFADCELAWTSFKTAVRKFKFRWQGMLQQDMKNKEERFHPTQKPVALMRWILENYSKEGDLICDPFLGSGTTAVACVQTGRHYIGIEQSAEYCAIAERRIQSAVQQIGMGI